MKKLHLYFLDSTGKKQRLTPKVAAENLTAEEVRSNMEELVALQLFQRNDAVLYETAESAKYVETIETSLF